MLDASPLAVAEVVNHQYAKNHLADGKQKE
jgi:hypothetical protein